MIAGLEEISGGVDRDRRARGQRPAAALAQHLDGVPVLRALSAHDGAREHGLLAEDRRRGRRKRWSAASPRRRRSSASTRLLERRPVAAVRRPAPARRHGPRHRARSRRLPVRRAAVQPRRQAAHADAHRDQEAACQGALDRDLRHARPGRGDDAVRPHRHHARRLYRAGRHARRGVPAAGRPASSPASSARRR